jgi:putative PIN family toxin of toxin-antitoxin system
MKVLIDTNVYLSYLLAPTNQRIVTTVVDTCLSHGEIEVIVPREQIAEFSTKVATKRYFLKQIPHATVDQFVTQLKALATQPSTLEDVATYSRDPKDDYLVAYGVINEVDFLVTGDSDLLVLARIGTMIILRPADFLGILNERGFVV